MRRFSALFIKGSRRVISVVAVPDPACRSRVDEGVVEPGSDGDAPSSAIDVGAVGISEHLQ